MSDQLKILVDAAKKIHAAEHPAQPDMTPDQAVELIYRLKYMQEFAVYILALEALYMNLVRLRDECKGSDGKFERMAICRRMRGMQVQISKAGSLWNGLASGKVKPWLDNMPPSTASEVVKG